MLQSLARAQRINFRVCPKTFNEVWDLRQSKTRRIFYTTVYVAKPAAPPYRRCLMAKKPTEGRRKLVEFDAPTWHALNLLSRESMKSFQELADEAFQDFLHKQGRPTDLKSALGESAKGSVKRRPRATRYI